MKVDEFTLSIQHDGIVLKVPVSISRKGLSCRICVQIGDKEVIFVRDEHGGLKPFDYYDFDPQLLFLIAREIETHENALI